MMAEADCYFSPLEAYRRPDAAYLTREQIKHPNTASEAPGLVIEVSSPSNSDLKNKKKILEYGDTCSADPVVPGLRILMEEIFE